MQLLLSIVFDGGRPLHQLHFPGRYPANVGFFQTDSICLHAHLSDNTLFPRLIGDRERGH